MVQQQPPWPLPRWAGLQLCRFQGQRGSSQDHSLRGAVAVLVEHGMHCLAVEERVLSLRGRGSWPEGS